MNVRYFIFTMIMLMRLDSVFVILGRATGISRKNEVYACVNFVVEKRDSSKRKVRNIKITRMLML